jgi:hypothetical protein
MFDLGDTVTLTYPSKPASPATVTVTIGLPDGTTSGPTSAMSGTFTYVPTLPGRYTVSWAATGPADAFNDTFDVVPVSSVISLADAKQHLRITTSTNDDELRLYLSAITDVVTAVCGPIVPATFTEIREATETIVLNKAPVTSLVSVVPAFPTQSYQAAAPSYTLENQTGILRQTFGFNDPAYAFAVEPYYGYYGLRLAITYTAGYAAVRAGLQLAVRMILGELWDARRGAGSVNVRASSDDEVPIPSNDDILNTDAIQLLRPFKLKGPRIR